jgi:hypothetical protein
VLLCCDKHNAEGLSEVSNQGLRALINTAVVHQAALLDALNANKAHEITIKMLKHTRNNVMRFTLCRLLFYLCLSKSTTQLLAQEFGIFELMFSFFFDATESPNFLLNDDDVRLAREASKVLFLVNSDFPFKGDRVQ